MNKIAILLIVCLLNACSVKKDPATENIPSLPVTILGKWLSTSVDYSKDHHNGTIEHVSMIGPFAGKVDMIEYLQFSPDTLLLKIGNDSIPLAYKYFYNSSARLILITDGVKTDTLFEYVSLTAKEIDFSYTEWDTVGTKIITSEYNYSAKKQ